MFKASFAAACAALLLAWMAGPAQAQSYPARPIRIIVPQPPGGGFDLVGRTLAERLGKQMGVAVVVENRPGSGTLVGTDAAAKAAPDGYTLLVGSVSNMVLNTGLYAKLPYDPVRDFEPLGLAASYSYTLMARKDLEQASLRELIAFAKANPKRLSYASAGNGSGQHVLAAALWQLAGVELLHVPYRGAQAAYQDLLGGRVDLFFDLSSTARPQVDAGKVRALAVSGPLRHPLHPDVPTLAESGVTLELESWFGLFAPSATPTDVLQRLRRELVQASAAPEVTELFSKAGGKAVALDAEATRALLRRDLERWGPLLKSLAIHAE